MASLELESIAESLTAEEIPAKLRCAGCNRFVGFNAFKLPCCDQSICDSCQETISKTCPVCDHSPLEPGDIIASKSLRMTAKAFLRGEASKREKQRKDAEALNNPASQISPTTEADTSKQDEHAAAATTNEPQLEAEAAKQTAGESDEMDLADSDEAGAEGLSHTGLEESQNEASMHDEEPIAVNDDGEGKDYAVQPQMDFSGMSNMNWNQNAIFNPMMAMGMPNMMSQLTPLSQHPRFPNITPDMGMDPTMMMTSGMFGNGSMGFAGDFGGWGMNGMSGNYGDYSGFYPSNAFNHHHGQSTHFNNAYHAPMRSRGRGAFRGLGRDPGQPIPTNAPKGPRALVGNAGNPNQMTSTRIADTTNESEVVVHVEAQDNDETPATEHQQESLNDSSARDPDLNSDAAPATIETYSAAQQEPELTHQQSQDYTYIPRGRELPRGYGRGFGRGIRGYGRGITHGRGDYNGVQGHAYQQAQESIAPGVQGAPTGPKAMRQAPPSFGHRGGRGGHAIFPLQQRDSTFSGQRQGDQDPEHDHSGGRVVEMEDDSKQFESQHESSRRHKSSRDAEQDRESEGRSHHHGHRSRRRRSRSPSSQSEVHSERHHHKSSHSSHKRSERHKYRDREDERHSRSSRRDRSTSHERRRHRRDAHDSRETRTKDIDTTQPETSNVDQHALEREARNRERLLKEQQRIGSRATDVKPDRRKRHRNSGDADDGEEEHRSRGGSSSKRREHRRLSYYDDSDEARAAKVENSREAARWRR